jgi:hypothetical protein
VVTLGGQGDAASGFAHGAQWRTGEQLSAHALQLAACGALCRCCLDGPCGLGVLGAPTRSVSHQDAAAGMPARLRGREHMGVGLGPAGLRLLGVGVGAACSWHFSTVPEM